MRSRLRSTRLREAVITKRSRDNGRYDDVIYLDEDRVRALLEWDRLIEAMEAALAAFSAGRVRHPVRSIITVEEQRRFLGIMPAAADEVMGAKLVSFYPANE